MLLTLSPHLNDLFKHAHTMQALFCPPAFACHEAELHSHLPPSVVPHGRQYDLVQQVEVKLLGHLQACPLHSHGGGETKDDAQAAEHAEHGQIPRVAEATVLQHRGTERLVGDVAAALCSI